jgi:hypothetical protein
MMRVVVLALLLAMMCASAQAQQAEVQACVEEAHAQGYQEFEASYNSGTNSVETNVPRFYIRDAFGSISAYGRNALHAFIMCMNLKGLPIKNWQYPDHPFTAADAETPLIGQF